MVEVAGEDPRPPMAPGVHEAVSSPVSRDEVRKAVPVEIPHRHAIPPTGERLEPEGTGSFRPPAVLAGEDADRAKLTGENQFRPPVPVEVGKQGVGHRFDAVPNGRILGSQGSLVIAEETGAAGLGPAPCVQTGSDEDIEIAIPIRVADRDRARACASSRERSAGLSARRDNIPSQGGRRGRSSSGFVVGEASEDCPRATGSDPSNRGTEIVGNRGTGHRQW